MMEAIRYFLTAALIVLLPAVAAFWFVMHGGEALWKRLHPAAAYSAATLAIVAVLAATTPNLRALAGADLGTHPMLFATGAAIYVASLIPMRRVHRKLDLRTFAGVAEIRNEQTGLLTSGPYAFVRHPRYLMVVIGIAGWALAANHAGGYLFSILFLPALVVVIMLEERELARRFGAAYLDYKRRTPMLAPSLGALLRRADKERNEPE